MVTGSKKPRAAPKKAPGKASKAKVTASGPKAKPKTSGVKAKTVKKTVVAAKAPKVRKVGEMVYNDELFESLAEAVLLAEAEMEGLLPEVKGQLFDYDIYLTSFLTDDEVGEIAKYLAGNGKGNVSANALKPKLLAIRDHARVFVRIAEEYNSVKAFIDRILGDDGRDKLKMTFSGGEFHLREIDPDTFESFLLLF
ncbi:MAG TPA: hypothetical protein VMC61_00910 [Methanocella sp.]|nr:hypothetical protein [Methanocella sp.]